MTAQFWLWLTTLAMLAGGLAILFIGKRRTPSEETHTILHGIVPIIAACSYFAMAIGQGSVTLPIEGVPGATREFLYARYVDWTFTTPLLLLTLSMTSQHSGIRRPGAVGGLLLADVIMVATAMFFGFSVISWIKWTWFLISCIAFLGVYYVLWVSYMQEVAAEREDVQSNYRRNATILSALWAAYPVVLLIGSDGLGWIGSAGSVFLIAVLDISAKVAFGLMVTFSHAKTVDRDLAEHGTPQKVRMAA